MPRTLNATLKTALDSGVFNACIKAVYYASGTPYERDVLRYKLTGTELEIETSDYVGSTYPAYIALKRGVVVDGTEYTVTTSKFYIAERDFEIFEGTRRRIALRATLFPEDRVTVAGDNTYQNVISAFCTGFGKTAVFEDSAAAYWGYQFLPAGKSVIHNNAMQFLNLLRQKYFIFAADNGGEEVLFYHALDHREADVQYTVWYRRTIDFMEGDLVTNNLINLEVKPLAQRTYMARDENGTVRSGGTADKPIHNLGYLESTDAFPAKSTNPDSFEWEMPVNLYPLDGDIVALDPDYLAWNAYPLQVVEEFNPKKKSMGWTTTIKQCQAFENTAGGALPGTIERVSNYTPLSTTNFDTLLNSSDNNLQAAIDTLDDHQHDGPMLVQGNLNLYTVGAGVTTYAGPGLIAFNAVRLDAAFTMPFTGRLSNLRVRTSSAQPATGTLVITVLSGTTATALEITVAAGAAASGFSDTADTVTISGGTTVSLRFVNNAAAASAQVVGWGLVVRAATSTL